MSSCCSLPFILNTNSAELCDASKTSQKQPSLQQDISPCHNSIDQLPKLHNIKQQQQMQRQSVSAPATQSLPSAVDNPSCWIPKAPRHWTTSTTLPPCHSNVNHPITNVNICEQQRLQPLASTGHSNNVFVPPSVYNQRQQHLEYSSKSLTPYYYYRPSFRPGRHYYNQQFGIRPIMGHKVTASILSSVDFNDFKGSSGYPKGKIIRNRHNNIISHQKEHCFIERKSFQRRRYISKIAIGQSTSIKPQLLTLLIEGSSVESNNDFTSDTILPAQQCNTDVKKMYRLPTKRKFALLPLNLNQIHIEFSQPPDSISEKQSTIVATTETKGFKGKNFNSFSKKSINNSISKNSKSQLSAFFIEGSSLASNNPTFMNDAIHKTTSDITLTQCSTTHYPLTKRKSVSLVNLNQIHIKFSQPFESNKHSIIVNKRNMFKVKCATDKSMDQHKSDSIDCPPVNDVSTCMFFPQDSTNKAFKTVLPKLKRLNKKIAKEIPIERNFGPPRTTYLNATSSYVTRSSTLRLEKKAKIAEDTFKMPNLYPDLFIVGSQFQSLSKLSDMVGDVIEITFNTVNNIIEATQERLKNLQRGRNHRVWSKKGRLSVLLEEENDYSNEDIMDRANESRGGQSVRRKVKQQGRSQLLASQFAKKSSHRDSIDDDLLYDSESDTSSIDMRLLSSSHRRRNKIGSNSLADKSLASDSAVRRRERRERKERRKRLQKKRLIKRLKKEGMDLITEEEAEMILNQAKSDIKQVNRQNYDNLMPDEIKEMKKLRREHRKLMRKKKRIDRRRRRRRHAASNGSASDGKYDSRMQSDEEDEYLEEMDIERGLRRKGRSNRHRNNKKHRRSDKRRNKKRNKRRNEGESGEESSGESRGGSRGRNKRRHKGRHKRRNKGKNKRRNIDHNGNDGDEDTDGYSDEYSDEYSSCDDDYSDDYSDDDSGDFSDDSGDYSDDDDYSGDYSDDDDYSSDDDYSDEYSDETTSSTDYDNREFSTNDNRSVQRKKRRHHRKRNDSDISINEELLENGELSTTRRRRRRRRRHHGDKDVNGDPEEFSDSRDSGDKDRSFNRRRRRKLYKQMLKASQRGSSGGFSGSKRSVRKHGGTDDPMLGISRPCSTLSKPPTGEGRHSQSSSSFITGGGLDKHQQRMIKVTSENNQIILKEKERIRQDEFEDDRLKDEREERKRELEAMYLDDFDKQEVDIRKRRRLEKEARVNAEVERIRKEKHDEEKIFQSYARKEANEKMISQRLQNLKKEIEQKQLLHLYDQAVVDSYYENVETWEEVDYSNIEYYLGKECCMKIIAIDKQRRLADAILMEQRLIESFELKRQELLLKLKKAHDKFCENLSEENSDLDQSSKISRAFVTSYFCYLDDSSSFMLNRFLSL